MEDHSREGSPPTARDLGFRAAAEAIENFIGMFGEDEPSRPGPRTPVRQLRADLARAIDANLDLVRRALDLYAGVVERAVAEEGEEADRSLPLPAALPGQPSSGTLWIHNTTSEVAPALLPRGSDLETPTGERIAATNISFEPAQIDRLGPGASQPVAVTVATDPTTPPGLYRGYVFVPNLAEEFVSLQLRVTALPDAEEGGWNGPPPAW